MFDSNESTTPPATSDLRKPKKHSLVLLSELDESEVVVEPLNSESQKVNMDERPLIECLKVVGDWDIEELSRVKEHLHSVNKMVVLEGKERRKKVNYWVVIPPFSSKQEVITAKRDLQSEKIVDTFIIQSGVRVNALSLGLYSTEEGAQKRARDVNDKQLGISEANIEELILYVDRYWIKVAPTNGDLELILSTIGKGIIDTQFERCEMTDIDR